MERMTGRGGKSAGMGRAQHQHGLGWVTAATSDLESLTGCRGGESQMVVEGGVDGHAC